MWKLSLESLSKFWGTEHIDTWNHQQRSFSIRSPSSCMSEGHSKATPFLAVWFGSAQHGMVCMAWHQWPCQEPIDWRYLPCIRPKFQRISQQNMALYGTDWYSTFILGSRNSHWSISHLPHLQSTQDSPKHRTDPPPPSHISWLCLSTSRCLGYPGYPLVMTNSLLLKMAIYSGFSH